MNILITGNLNTLASTMAQELSRDKHKIVLAAKNIKSIFKKNESKLLLHSISPSHPDFADAMTSYKFDSVIYFATREEQLDTESEAETGQLLDGLKNVLKMSNLSAVDKLFFVSSTEVYGDQTDATESDSPNPLSVNGHTIFAGEQYCRYYSDNFDLTTILVRVPYIYGVNEPKTFIHDLISKCSEETIVPIDAKEDKRVNFLHSDDFSQFVRLALNEPFSDNITTVNLTSNDDYSLVKVSELLEPHFPGVSFVFSEVNSLYTRPAEGSFARKKLGWVDAHRFSEEISLITEEILNPKPHEETAVQRFVEGYLKSRYFLRWIELGLGAILMHWLSDLTGTLIQFKYVDFRLLFVVLMATVYGMRFGLYSAVLASLSIIYTWFQLGLDWELLTQNVGNWFPFVVYFSAGIIIGFIRDRKETEIAYEKKQTKLIYEKYSFLYNVFNEIRDLKDDFREQLVGYRESFGRVLKVSQELDTLQEEEVFLKALKIFEDILETDSVAMYSMSDNNFARLEVSSTPLISKISKSLNLKEYPDLITPIEEGIIYQNKSLLPEYPAYVAPIMNGDKAVALVVLWNVKFEDYSENYSNLFKVMCGFFQSSLVRASLFLHANSENIYLPSTRILKPEAFFRALKIKEEMKRNKVADYQLIRIFCSEKKLEILNAKISEKIRDTDFIGIDEKEQFYIIFSQAEDATETKIMERLGEFVDKFELIESRDLLPSKNQK